MEGGKVTAQPKEIITMKTLPVTVTLACLVIAVASRAAEPDSARSAATSGRVGIYDSRVIAYAHFWSEPATKQRNDLVARAKAAKNAGDTEVLKTLEGQIATVHRRSHQQVFGTAPADEAMAALGPKRLALQQELGVDRLVSKWDAKVLQEIPETDRVDVTDRLVREFITPTEKQRKIIESMKAAKPVALWKARVLTAFGKL
jgi:hypothetical protein